MATFTIDTFPDDYELINNQYILVVDSRSVKDMTVMLAEIPVQIKFNDEKGAVEREHRFNRREEYVLDLKGWYGDDGEEIKVVRVRFEDVNMVNMSDDGYQTMGVWRCIRLGLMGCLRRARIIRIESGE